MKRLILCLAILGCGGGGNTPLVLADQALPLYVYNVRGPDSVSQSDAAQMVQWAAERYVSATGFTISYIVYEDVDVDAVHPNMDIHSSDTQSQMQRLWRFSSWLGLNKKWHKNALHYGIFPPMYCGDRKCFGGIAYGYCQIAGGGVAIGQAGRWSSHVPPRSRIPRGGGVVLAHEVGHLLNMSHRSYEDGYEPNIMDYAAGRFVDTDYYIGFLPQSVNDFSRCVTNTRKKRLDRCEKKPTKHKKRACKKRAYKWLALTDNEITIFPPFE